MTTKLAVTIRNKTSVLVKTDGEYVSLFDAVGPFDVLPGHANFVAIISGEVKVSHASGKMTKNACKRGLVRVVSDEVDVVFLEE